MIHVTFIFPERRFFDCQIPLYGNSFICLLFTLLSGEHIFDLAEIACSKYEILPGGHSYILVYIQQFLKKIYCRTFYSVFTLSAQQNIFCRIFLGKNLFEYFYRYQYIQKSLRGQNSFYSPYFNSAYSNNNSNNNVYQAS